MIVEEVVFMGCCVFTGVIGGVKTPSADVWGTVRDLEGRGDGDLMPMSTSSCGLFKEGGVLGGVGGRGGEGG